MLSLFLNYAIKMRCDFYMAFAADICIIVIRNINGNTDFIFQKAVYIKLKLKRTYNLCRNMIRVA